MPEGNPFQVALETPAHTGIGEPLTYLGEAGLPIGTLVRVPLARREVPGILWAAVEPAAEAPPIELKSLLHALTSMPPLGDRWRELVDFAAAYYQRGIGEVALSVLPPELRRLDDAQLRQRIARLHKALAASAVAAAATEPDQLAPPLAEAQRQVLHDLAQANAQGGALTALLHGVTGSGKTEIYLQAAAQTLAAGRQALVLVPEINLTPQLEARFAQRFAGRHIVSLHSGLTPAQRLRSWLAAHLGLADLVLGTRLAVFASMPRLGLIVVDEEHDASRSEERRCRERV